MSPLSVNLTNPFLVCQSTLLASPKAFDVAKSKRVSSVGECPDQPSTIEEDRFAFLRGVSNAICFNKLPVLAQTQNEKQKT
jgi:hypothetical protein